jgi:uncharacterized protein YjiS (DUF1127 family)
MKMNAQPAFQPDAVSETPRQGTLRDPRQAILFFGHVLERADLAQIPAAANEPYRSALADTWRRALAGCAHRVGRVVTGLLTWRDRAAGRRHLSGLDERLLKDIGLSPTDVWREADKHFWQP